MTHSTVAPGRWSGRACAIALAWALLAGCFTTRVGVENPADSGFERRQFFTLGGLVPITSPDGDECTGDISYAESRMAGWDIAINLALVAAGALLAPWACELPDNPSDTETAQYGTCTTIVAGAVPFMLGSRTVRYQCASPSWTTPAPTPELPPAPTPEP